MNTSASHSPAKPANPIEKTLAKVLGGFGRTDTGALDKKIYSGSRDFEFSKAGFFSGLKVKTLAPGQTLTPDRVSKRKAGEAAVIADIRQSTRTLNLDGTALITAIKGSQRLNVGHVLDCVSWMEFAASFKQAKPQVSALVVHLAQQGKLPSASDREAFSDAISTMLTSPSYTAATAWTDATGNAADHREPEAQRDGKSQARPGQRPATEINEEMFNSGIARESKREESPTTIVVHQAQARGPQLTPSTTPSRHATTPSLPAQTQTQPASLSTSQSSSQSSSVAAPGSAPSLATIANELMAAKGGKKLVPELAVGLANLIVNVANANDLTVADMMPHARAVVLENMLGVTATPLQELPHVTPMRQPLREFIAQSQWRFEAAKHPVAEPEYWPTKVINISAR